MALATAPRPSFKDHFKHEWERTGNRREAIAGHWLLLALKDFITAEDLNVEGNGTLSPELNDFYDGTPDFKIPKLNLIFEVTGSDKTKEFSTARCMEHEGVVEPHLFVREGKVFAARQANIVKRLFFISVNDLEDIVVIPCTRILEKDYRIVGWYEHHVGLECQPYYMIPWAHWWKPKQLRDYVGKRLAGANAHAKPKPSFAPVLHKEGI